MKSISKYLFFSLLFIFLLGCSKTDKDFSLIDPAFKRCHLSKVRVNNQTWIEVVYKDNISFEVDKVLYYENGVIRDDWTESYTYSDGKISSRADQYNTISYQYNDHGDIAVIKNCSGNSCCTSTYNYDYTINNLPFKVTTICDDGQSAVEQFDYTNIGNRSYFYIYQDKSGSSVSSYQKFVLNFINPLHEIYPNEVDYYQDRIVEDYKERKFKEYLIDNNDLKGRYPAKLTEEISQLPNFTFLENNVYTFDYVGCD